MPVVPISDPDDPRLGDYRAISEPALVRQRGLFVAEGRLIVRRLLEGSRFAVRSLLVAPAALREIEPLLAAHEPLPVYLADAAVLAAAGGFNFHRGCLAIGIRPTAAPFDPGSLAVSRRLVILESIAQADNVGSIFRNAAAFGADRVLLDPGCCDPLYRKALRTSMGAILTVPFVRLASWPNDLARIRRAGFTLAALTPRADAAPIASLRPRRNDRLAVIAGGEGAGLSDDALNLADAQIRIPMAPGIDSLNVATATGIAMYELWSASHTQDGSEA